MSTSSACARNSAMPCGSRRCGASATGWSPVLSRLAWLLAAMLVTALLTLVAGNVIANQISAASGDAADHAKALAIAQAIASQVQADADADDLEALQRVLPSDQITVTRNGTTVFAGPAMTSDELESTVTAPLPGGQVELRDYHAPAPGGLAQGTLTAGVIALVIIG